MTTQDQQDDPKTAALLAAALALREHQLAFIRREQAIAIVAAKKKAAEAVLSDAELELAEADADYANARLKVMRLIREKRRLEIIQVTKSPSSAVVRAELWRLCATGTNEQIIAAADAYSATTSDYWEAAQAKQARESELEQAHEVLATASAARKAAVQKRGKARADVEAADTELNDARRANLPESLGMFALEQAVTDAALEMNGIGDREFAYSYVSTRDLGITGPGLELPPKEDGSAEAKVRFWEQHCFGRKPEPAREE